MENSVLKNKLAPNQKKGRWYKAFIESDGTDYTLTTCDLSDATITSKVLVLPEGIRHTEVHVDIHVDAAAAFTYTPQFKGYAAGTQGITLPDADQFDYMTMWFYAFREA